MPMPRNQVFDWIANFFESPIDLWQGPVEDRFGWYGNADRGHLSPHPANAERRLVAAGTSRAFLVFPLGADFDGDDYELNESRYENPLGIFGSLEEAKKFASENTVLLTGELSLPDLVQQQPGFELSRSPNCAMICELLENRWT